METPRTVAGGERGTPRDPQRLALGERPHVPMLPRVEREGGGYPPILSPQHTVRSVSDYWPMTPSSDPGLSSRSLRSELFVPEEGGAGFTQSTPTFGAAYEAPQAAAPLSDLDGPMYHLELSKALEVMRFVIMRENQKLREMLQRTHDSIAELSLDPAGLVPPAEADALASEALPSRALAGEILEASEVEPIVPVARGTRRCIEWHAPASGMWGWCEQKEVHLFAYPGVTFSLSFYPRVASAEASQAAGSAASYCKLVLDVSGLGCDGLELHVNLSIEGGASRGSSSVDRLSVVASAAPDQAEQGEPEGQVLRGGGRAFCLVPWPLPALLAPGAASGAALGIERPAASAASAAALCRVVVGERCYGAGAVHLEGRRPLAT